MGTTREAEQAIACYIKVSIQLMSPASGDDKTNEHLRNYKNHQVSIQLMSPASGDYVCTNRGMYALVVSIQLMSPASGDLV